MAVTGMIRNTSHAKAHQLKKYPSNINKDVEINGMLAMSLSEEFEDNIAYTGKMKKINQEITHKL